MPLSCVYPNYLVKLLWIDILREVALVRVVVVPRDWNISALRNEKGERARGKEGIEIGRRKISM